MGAVLGNRAHTRGGSLYTPEAVVQGGKDCVGSNDGALRALIQGAAQSTVAKVEVQAAGAGTIVGIGTTQPLSTP